MKKKDFVTLIMSTVGGVLFALGMCMALLPEWGAMLPGVVVGAIGAVVLLAMVLVRRKMSGKPAIVFNGKAIGTSLLGAAGAIIFGVGMCMTMVWMGHWFLPGVGIGIVGIAAVAAAYPIYQRIIRKEQEKIAPQILKLTEEFSHSAE